MDGCPVQGVPRPSSIVSWDLLPSENNLSWIINDWTHQTFLIAIQIIISFFKLIATWHAFSWNILKLQPPLQKTLTCYFVFSPVSCDSYFCHVSSAVLKNFFYAVMISMCFAVKKRRRKKLYKSGSWVKSLGFWLMRLRNLLWLHCNFCFVIQICNGRNLPDECRKSSDFSPSPLNNIGCCLFLTNVLISTVQDVSVCMCSVIFWVFTFYFLLYSISDVNIALAIATFIQQLVVLLVTLQQWWQKYSNI